MKKIVPFFSFIVALFSAICSYGQSPPPPKPTPKAGTAPPAAVVAPCPQVQIQAAQQPVREGSPVAFAAAISGGDPGVTPIYSWSTTAGTLVSGQGTRNIVVDSNGAGADRKIIADLLIGGYSSECTNQATATVMIAGPATKVDEFGELPEKDEAMRLEQLYPFLTQYSDRLYIFAYAGRSNVRGYASDAARRLKAYMVKAGIPSDRISANDAGFREQPAFEFWLVPIGSETPRPTPTIDRKDIVYPKPPPRVKKP